MNGLTSRGRVVVAAVSAVLLAGVAVGYIRFAAGRDDADQAVRASAHGERLTLTPGPRLLTVTDRHLAVVAAADPSGARSISDVECVRAYAAAGTGVCLRPDSQWAYRLVVLDERLAETRSIPIPGLPNRARVSASGRMVAWTTFVGGDSYNSGGFSTRTGILDTRAGTLVNSLEEFAVVREGQPYRSVDANFWGVTFAGDDNLFYATMSTGGQRYLVQGDFAARIVRTLTGNVECPSLSPDGTRIAFKQAIGGDPTKGWRLSVLDLATMATRPLAETNSVDDQAAWLDDATVAYTLRQADGRPDIWSVPADGSGSPRLLVPEAESPATLAPVG
ncbi:TolB family protein [Micromonospora sp. NPDC050417]|uniref:TolB family protein n=1 Tax=Micromonospora sp. NPDC050417 TaxID=3364280 RepID=UPI0037964D36